jgi:hypothetical protein
MRHLRILTYILATVTLSFSAVPVSAQVRNINCPSNIVSEYASISDDAQKLGAQAQITHVVCQQLSIGIIIDHLSVRAKDGRVMTWRPDDGTRVLTRMLRYGY